jgi:hypothetical protein
LVVAAVVLRDQILVDVVVVLEADHVILDPQVQEHQVKVMQVVLDQLQRHLLGMAVVVVVLERPEVILTQLVVVTDQVVMEVQEQLHHILDHQSHMRVVVAEQHKAIIIMLLFMADMEVQAEVVLVQQTHKATFLIQVTTDQQTQVVVVVDVQMQGLKEALVVPV